MFDNFISTTALDTASEQYHCMVAALEQSFAYRASARANDITGFGDFTELHELTRGFYREFFSDIALNYVPLYHSLWKMRFRDVNKLENIHQDGGVHYFSRNGYQSRMVTLWTNIYKEHVPGLSPSDMGLFVIDNEAAANVQLYERLAELNTHFFVKRRNQLTDNMYIGGHSIPCDLSKLERRYFDYEPGTSISFNSHLLHGSKPCETDISTYAPEVLDRYRVSLTSVWLHEEDVNWSVVSMREPEYERLYLSRLEKPMWPLARRNFRGACQHERSRLRAISRLIQAHAGEARP